MSLRTQYLYPVAEGDYTDFLLTSGSNKVSAVQAGLDQLTPPVHDDDASEVSGQLGYVQEYVFEPATSGIEIISAVRICGRARIQAEPGQPGASLITVRASTRYAGVEGAYVEIGFAAGGHGDAKATVAKWDGSAWAKADLYLGFRGKFEYNRNDGAHDDYLRFTSVWFEIDYEAPSTGLSVAARQIAGRKLLLRATRSGEIEAAVPSLRWVSEELGARVLNLSHPGLPSIDGRGAGVRSWERWPVLLVGRETDEPNNRETLRLRDLRGLLTTFYDGSKSDRYPGLLEDGVLLLTSGGGRTCYRSSDDWVLTPANTLAKAPKFYEKVDARGRLFERGGLNLIAHPSFDAGTFTGWTTSGSGTASAETGAEFQLFDPITTNSPRCAKLVAGSPISADFQLASTATSTVAANSIVRVSIWRQDADASHPLSWALQRAVDSKWWRESDGTWQASKAWNTLSGATTRARAKSGRIDVGASGTTLTLFVGVPTAGHAGQINYAQHVQLEVLGWVSSPMLSTARAADQVVIQMQSGQEECPPERGTAACQFEPLFDAADDPTLTHVLWTAWFGGVGSNSYDRLLYSGPDGELWFHRVVAGVGYVATIPFAPVAGQLYSIACRWLGSEAAFGLDPFTLSIYLNGAKGTDAVAVAQTSGTGPALELGSAQGVDLADGYIWPFRFTQQALPDEWIARYW